MKSKGIWRVTVSVLLALMLASMTACDGGGTTVNPPPGPPAVEKTVALSESSYVLDRYESFTLTAAVKDKDGNPLTDAVVWSNHHTIYAAHFNVGNHTLKIRTLEIGSRIAVVYIFVNNEQVILLCVTA